MTRNTRDRIRPGEVFLYPYLWRREGDRGETEGRKERPVCLAIRWNLGERRLMIFLPITGSVPSADQTAIEIPLTELKRIGLDLSRRGWIIVSEGNLDDIDRSFYFDGSEKPLGRFGKKFMISVIRALHPFLKERLRFVDRR